MLITLKPERNDMEYAYCIFCGKTTWCERHTGNIGDKVYEWLICIDCKRETI